MRDSDSPVIADLYRRARKRRARIALPEVEDPRVQEARARIEAESLAEVEWVADPAVDPRLDEVAFHIYHRRKHKGVDEAEALRLAQDPLCFAASLVALGQVDAAVAGACHPTPEVIRAGLYCIGTGEEGGMVSSFFLMVKGEQALSYADCGVVPDPDPDELCRIAAATAANHRLLTGRAPRVAFLSFSTRGSAEHPMVEKVRTAARRFAELHPDIDSDGELQFDAACVPAVAARKAPDSPVAGRADVLVFPDLDAGNIAYKITERLAGYAAFGPLLQGLRRPLLDLSRGCTPDDITAVAAIAALMAG